MHWHFSYIHCVRFRSAFVCLLRGGQIRCAFQAHSPSQHIWRHMHHKWNHWRSNYMGFWSQSITESPPAVLVMIWGPDQVGMWLFTFITCQPNNGLRGEVEQWAEGERTEFRLPLTAQAVWCKNISLCEPRRQGEMCYVGEHIDAGLLKIMFSESAWHSFVHDAAGLCRKPPPASLHFFSSPFLLWGLAFVQRSNVFVS